MISSETDEEKTWSAIKEAVDRLWTSENRSSVRQTVLNLLRELSGHENISEKATLLDTLGLDSLDMVTMLITIEDMMGVELSPDDMDPFALRTVGDVIALAEKYQAGESHE